ncbi:hypothetical protein ACJIZ3_012632 [Penstemon smallii]|uniref:Ubiquitin-like protease family profile domain-containing protein n=1 Tax=Penstemon smallii TaxID=265156 RepID=A0ABD3UR52_9LAMI
MANAKGDEKILSYDDVVLRRSDLDILSGPYFINDRIIEFFFSYLTHKYPYNDILLVPPSIAFWIKECPDIESLKDFVEPLNLPQKNVIIFPINDNDDVGMAEGGSHWSLLAFERSANVFVHHDSSRGLNSEHAKKVYRAVKYFTTSDAEYVEWSSAPRQENGYDCGLYVLAIARTICCLYDDRADMKDLLFAAVKKLTSSFVSNMRNEILEMVRVRMIKQ